MPNPYINAGKSYTAKPKQSSYSIHTHDVYEIYYFISGNAKYFVEGNIYPLKPGDLLITKRAEAHSLLINGNMPYERMVISFNSDAIMSNVREKIISIIDGRPLGMNNRYSAYIFKDTHWHYYFETICSLKDIHKQMIYLTALLIELCDNYEKIRDKEVIRGDMMEIVDYINCHLTDNISLDKICNHFYISKTQINRKFKQVIGTTVWEYILTKRLLLAKELLQNGEHPTDAYIKCGFKDYCTFFRAYKTKFGISPKSDFLKPSADYLTKKI